MDDVLRQRPNSPRRQVVEENDVDDGDGVSSSSADAAAGGGHDHSPPSSRCSRMHPGSVSNLCSATLGAGALSLPFAMSLTGIIFGVILLVCSAYLTIVSIDVIIEACVRTELFVYEGESFCNA